MVMFLFYLIKIEASKALYSQQVSDSNLQILQNQFKSLNLNTFCSNELSQVINATALQVAQLKAYGLDNEAKTIQNKYLPETLETTLSNMKKQGLLTDEQIRQVRMSWQTGYMLCEANIIHLHHQNNLLDQQSQTEKSKRSLLGEQSVGQALQNMYFTPTPYQRGYHGDIRPRSRYDALQLMSDMFNGDLSFGAESEHGFDGSFFGVPGFKFGGKGGLRLKGNVRLGFSKGNH